MLERQRDSRRQRHIEALKECERYVEQFSDTFAERKAEIRERVRLFFAGSDIEIDRIMGGLTDELLLANEITYVNGVWEKVSHHRQARKDEVATLRRSFDNLKVFQRKGSGAYLESMRQNLIDIAFYLAPEVDAMIAKQVAEEKEKYRLEHLSNDEFYEETVKAEADKFDVLYNQWKESVLRFHYLKQEDAIRRFLELMESKRFVNASTRCDIFERLKAEQLRVFESRMELIKQLDDTPSNKLTKDFVQTVDDKLRQLNDDA